MKMCSGSEEDERAYQKAKIQKSKGEVMSLEEVKKNLDYEV